MALKPIWPGVIATLGTIALVVVVHTGWLSYQNWTRGMQAPLSFAEEVQRRLQDPEVNHFILGTEAMDFWMLTLTRGAVSSGNQAWLEDIRPAVEDVQNRWQGPWFGAPWPRSTVLWVMSNRCVVTSNSSKLCNQSRVQNFANIIAT